MMILFAAFRLDVMQACWHSDPECRPSFGTIINMLEPYVGAVFRTNSFYLNQPSTSGRQDISQGDEEGVVVLEAAEDGDESRKRLLATSPSDPHSPSTASVVCLEGGTVARVALKGRENMEEGEEVESIASR